MNIVITDLTEMSPGKCCVAGWDVEERRMIRLLPNGSNWREAWIDRYTVFPGYFGQPRPSGTATGSYPHLTKDAPIDPASLKPFVELTSDWIDQCPPETAPDLVSAFDGYLRWDSQWDGVKRGLHVWPGAQCRSLVGLWLPRGNLELYGSDRLRGQFYDGVHIYDMAVSARVLKRAWRAGGVEAATEALPDKAEVHVRVGLARADARFPKCYAMLNGVL